MVTSRERTAPKTALGFFALVLTILTSGGILLTAVLARVEELHYMIPAVLIVVGVLFFLLICAVVGMLILGDPTRLQLGEMTGKEYKEYRQMVLGDNVEGVRPAIEVLSSQEPQVSGEADEERRELTVLISAKAKAWWHHMTNAWVIDSEENTAWWRDKIEQLLKLPETTPLPSVLVLTLPPIGARGWAYWGPNSSNQIDWFRKEYQD